MSKNIENQDIKPGFKMDLCGVACPLNYVKTKMQLDKMNVDEVLEILIDSGEAIESVPRSVCEDGHEIIDSKEIENYFKVTIKKC